MAEMKPVEKMVIVTGQWQDPQSGQTKYRYMTIGRVFERSNGQRVSLIDAMPVGEAAKNWNGWVNYYPIDEQSGGQQ
ncbi:MAG: hypothetical protein B0D91_13075 [Oceanospirillales bacterium LUC14_002_19_P2]|nr:MAG: hypothetical protein B0D91_13075 [Oceanospirillales bacterium LUC14_002_19_P2]